MRKKSAHDPAWKKVQKFFIPYKEARKMLDDFEKSKPKVGILGIQSSNKPGKRYMKIYFAGLKRDEDLI